MDTDTQDRLARLERRIDNVVTFCEGVLKLAMPAIPKLLRPTVRALSNVLKQD